MFHKGRLFHVTALLVAAQIGCLAVGLCVHYRYVASVVRHAEAAGGAEAPAAGPPLDEARVSSAAVLGSLPAAAAIACGLTGVLAVMSGFLVLSPFWEKLSHERTKAEMHALQQLRSLMRVRDALVFSLAQVAEFRDPTIGRHLHRVSLYTHRLALSLRDDPKYRGTITPEFAETVALASVLHDIGKIAIEDSILFKPGRLTAAERARVGEHSLIGSMLLRDILRRLGPSDVLQTAEQVARWHHQRWEGGGDREGPVGEAIPLAARIVAVADVYEALSSPRDYKPAYPHERCVEYVRSEAGKLFDPDLVAAFLRIENACREINRQHGETDAGPGNPPGKADAVDRDLCVGLVAFQETVKELREIAAVAAVPPTDSPHSPAVPTPAPQGGDQPWNA